MTTAALDRLRNGRDVAAVLRGRRQRAGRLVVVHARGREDAGPCRVAVVASRRIGNAVARNRVKRLLRAAARQVAWQPGVDVVLVGRAMAVQQGCGEVAAELERLADTMGLTVGSTRGSERQRRAVS